LFNFQFSPPTRPIREKKSVKKEAEPDVTVLSLAPFTPNPKLFFENVKVGQTSTQKLLVRNPTDHAIQVIVMHVSLLLLTNVYAC
jgi:hypothetical protein